MHTSYRFALAVISGSIFAFSACELETKQPDGYCDRCADKWAPECVADCGIQAPSTCPQECQSVDTWVTETCDLPCTFSDLDAGPATGGTGSGGSPVTGGTAGTGGAMPGGAGGATGGSGGVMTGGAGGAPGGAGGATGGSGGAMPEAGLCDEACSGMTPICDETSNSCVACTENIHCLTAEAPICDTDTNTCVPCVENTDCLTAEAPICDSDTNTCVGCLQNSDCIAPDASRCDLNTNTCVGCENALDCEGITEDGTALTICDAQECVECTGTNYGTCGTNDMGKVLVCDSLARRCSDTAVEEGAGLCQPCVSDAECNTGQACILEPFPKDDPSQTVGYFCHWKRGSGVGGAPDSCLTQGRPYIETLTAIATVDGVTVDACVLGASTCRALDDLSRNKGCANGAAPDDSVCGFAPPSDAKCVPADETFRCTMACGTDDDCPISFSCQTGTAQPHCKR